MTQREWRVRGYQADDADAVVALFADAARADSTLVPPSAAEWRSFSAQSFNRGARDFVVAAEAEQLVGVANSTRCVEEGRTLRHFRIFVHPAHRERGIGAAIFERIAGQDPDGDATLDCSTLDDWTAGRAFLERRGFRTERLCRFMRIDDPTPAGACDVDIRPYAETREEDAAWRRLNDEGYAGGPDYAPLSPDDLVALRAEPGFSLRFAWQGDAMVGLCHIKEFGSEPWINSVVVTPACRRQGVARALMLAAMADETRRPLRLSVLERNAGARRLYDALGFRVERTETTWRREPERGAGGSAS